MLLQKNDDDKYIQKFKSEQFRELAAVRCGVWASLQQSLGFVCVGRPHARAQSGRLDATRRDLETKISVEEAARAARLTEVRSMEREELELIERLRRVQVLQQDAYSALEAALASRPLGSSRRGSAMSAMGSDGDRK